MVQGTLSRIAHMSSSGLLAMLSVALYVHLCLSCAPIRFTHGRPHRVELLFQSGEPLHVNIQLMIHIIEVPHDHLQHLLFVKRSAERL